MLRRIIFSIIYLLLATYAVISLDASKLHLILFPIIPLLFFLINTLNLKIPVIYEYIYLIFIFFSVGLGGMCNLYLIISWYDVLLHSLSGIIISFIPLYIIEIYEVTLPKYTKWFVVFIVSMGFASIWEIYEFIIDLIFNTDMQKTEHGVLDTMQDLSAHALTTLIFILVYYFDSKFFNSKIINKTKKYMKIYD